MNQQGGKRRFTWPGLVLTLAATLSFAWALWQIAFWQGSPFGTGSSGRMRNAKKVFSRLSDIRQGQEQYRKATGRYARFYIHLYRDVDEKGAPVDRGLIPQRLGFARSPKTAWDGYYYQDVHGCGREEKEERVPDAAWMVAAVPAKPGESGDLTLLACPEGVFATGDPAAALLFPCRPEPPAWIRVESPGDLARTPPAGQ
ncbi:MAG: hypothetical protein AB1921_10990 [Thermodesulfobacteriota bacterium]